MSHENSNNKRLTKSRGGKIAQSRKAASQDACCLEGRKKEGKTESGTEARIENEGNDQGRKEMK